ncbi:MAG: AraC family transcriptional regulator [Bacteroidota bacterium]|nr:AraC family transcriptional regulator [Bacteroidota bacterium]
MRSSKGYLVSEGDSFRIDLRAPPAGPGFALVISEFDVQSASDFLLSGYPGYARLVFALRKAFFVRNCLLPQYCCQLFYESGIDYKVHLPTAGHYELLSLYISLDRLHLFESSFYILKNFMQLVTERKDGCLTELAISAGPEIQRLVEEILEEVAYSKPDTRLLEARMEYLLLSYLKQITWYKIVTQHESTPAYDQDRIYDLGEYILRNLAGRFTFKNLSIRAGINEYRLKIEFKRIYGLTIFRFIMRARIQLAMQLLDTTGMSLNGISGEVGFSNIAHFSKSFKKQLGISPSRFRSKRIA